MSRNIFLLLLCGLGGLSEASEPSGASQKAIRGCELAGQYYLADEEDRLRFTRSLSERDGAMMIACGTNLKSVFTTLYAYPSPQLSADGICLPPDMGDISLAVLAPKVVEKIRAADVGELAAGESDVALITTSAILDILPIAFPCR